MADPKGFLNVTQREKSPNRSIEVRIKDWSEIKESADPETIRRQASRCMDCGIAFCHHGCPLGNLIPEWNDFIYKNDGRDAIERLHSTNNFPEFTGKLCPAPCESSCVLGINQPAVTIKEIELFAIEQAFDRGWVEPHPPERMTGKTVAIVGSGPAGLAAAQQLTRAGHTVAVYEKSDKIGGLLRYGIPDFKMQKSDLTRRLAQMEAEGTIFRTNINIGTDISWDDLRARYDAVLIATGANKPREIEASGRNLSGIHLAMDYLEQANRVVAGQSVINQITATGKNVVILGGGDTGADCLGTATRQGAESVTTLAIGIQPPTVRSTSQPWPMHPNLLETSGAYEEFGERLFESFTVEFIGQNGHVKGLKYAETELIDGKRSPKPGTEKIIEADLVLLALGYLGSSDSMQFGEVTISQTGADGLDREEDYSTSAEGVFVAGDAGRGSSLIVWAIAEGRAAAASIDNYLQGQTVLPAPIKATDRAIGH